MSLLRYVLTRRLSPGVSIFVLLPAFFTLQQFGQSIQMFSSQWVRGKEKKLQQEAFRLERKKLFLVQGFILYSPNTVPCIEMMFNKQTFIFFNFWNRRITWILLIYTEIRLENFNESHLRSLSLTLGSGRREPD